MNLPENIEQKKRGEKMTTKKEYEEKKKYFDTEYVEKDIFDKIMSNSENSTIKQEENA